MKRLLISLQILALIALVGCQRVRTEVSSFSSVSPTSVGDTFYILPSDQQKASAEFFQYADSIARRISKAGWRRTSNINAADYVVLVDYGISGSKEVVSSIPIYGQTGGGTAYHSGSFNTYGSGGVTGPYSGRTYTAPTFGVVGTMMDSSTQYQRYFRINIVERQTNKPVYEAQGASQGSSATFGKVAECIFDSTLADFPRSSSNRSTLMAEDCGK